MVRGMNAVNSNNKVTRLTKHHDYWLWSEMNLFKNEATLKGHPQYAAISITHVWVLKRYNGRVVLAAGILENVQDHYGACI